MAGARAVLLETRGTALRQGTMSSRHNGQPRSPGIAAAGNTAHTASPAHPAEHGIQERLLPGKPADPHKINSHRETGLLRDSLHVIERDGILHVISEDYSYKTEPYYTILTNELRGKNVRPTSMRCARCLCRADVP